MISILERQISALNIEENYKQAMLAPLFKATHSEIELKQDKVSILLRVGFKHIKLFNKMIAINKLDQASILLEFTQKSMNQIYQSDESYMWCLLKIRVIIARLQYIAKIEEQTIEKNFQRNEGAPTKTKKTFKSEKLGFKNRIHLFCQQIIKSQHCKNIEMDFYSQVEVVYYFGIQCLLLKIEKKTETSFDNWQKDKKIEEKEGIDVQMNKKDNDFASIQYLIMRCRNSIKAQIEKLCDHLKYEEKKVFEILQRKCEIFMKIYAIEVFLLDKIEGGEFSEASQQKIWNQTYNPILFKVPNRIDPSQINKLLFDIKNHNIKKISSENANKNDEKILKYLVNAISQRSQEDYDEEILKNQENQCLFKNIFSEAILTSDNYVRDNRLKLRKSSRFMQKSSSQDSIKEEGQSIYSDVVSSHPFLNKSKHRTSKRRFPDKNKLQFEEMSSKSLQQSFSQSQSDVSYELSTEKKLCLERLAKDTKNLKTRNNKENSHYLSIQYRHSLVQSQKEKTQNHLQHLHPEDHVIEQNQKSKNLPDFQIQTDKKPVKNKKQQKIGSSTLNSAIFKIAIQRNSKIKTNNKSKSISSLSNQNYLNSNIQNNKLSSSIKSLEKKKSLSENKKVAFNIDQTKRIQIKQGTGKHLQQTARKRKSKSLGIIKSNSMKKPLTQSSQAQYSNTFIILPLIMNNISIKSKEKSKRKLKL